MNGKYFPEDELPEELKRILGLGSNEQPNTYDFLNELEAALAAAMTGHGISVRVMRGSKSANHGMPDKCWTCPVGWRKCPLVGTFYPKPTQLDELLHEAKEAGKDHVVLHADHQALHRDHEQILTAVHDMLEQHLQQVEDMLEEQTATISDEVARRLYEERPSVRFRNWRIRTWDDISWGWEMHVAWPVLERIGSLNRAFKTYNTVLHNTLHPDQRINPHVYMGTGCALCGSTECDAYSEAVKALADSRMARFGRWTATAVLSLQALPARIRTWRPRLPKNPLKK